MPPIFFFIKFFDDEDYAREFVQGRLHVKRLSWFKRQESMVDLGHAGRIDPNEGTVGWMQRGRGVLTLNGEVIRDAQIQLQKDWLDHLHVFCLYAAHSGDLNMAVLAGANDVEAIRQQLLVPDECLSFGRYAIVVKDVARFVSRVDGTARAKKYGFQRELVEYYDPESFHGAFKENESVFRKQNRFAFQREFRFAFNTHTHGDDALTLDVGDLSDLTLCLDAMELNGEKWIGGNLRFAERE